MKIITAALIAVLLLVGCSAGLKTTIAGTGVKTAAIAPSPPTPSVSIDPNIATCVEALAVIGKVSKTFDILVNDEFNTGAGVALRAEATDLFGLEAKATGAAATAIHDVAKGLVGVSIAIGEQDDAAVAAAADAANGALANLQGACNI